MHIAHFAYLDAGTGSLIVQSIVGVAAGVAVFARRTVATVVYKVKSLFSGSKNSTKTK